LQCRRGLSSRQKNVAQVTQQNVVYATFEVSWNRPQVTRTIEWYQQSHSSYRRETFVSSLHWAMKSHRCSEWEAKMISELNEEGNLYWSCWWPVHPCTEVKIKCNLWNNDTDHQCCSGGMHMLPWQCSPVPWQCSLLPWQFDLLPWQCACCRGNVPRCRGSSTSCHVNVPVAMAMCPVAVAVQPVATVTQWTPLCLLNHVYFVSMLHRQVLQYCHRNI
jgi:hypothetical protein